MPTNWSSKEASKNEYFFYPKGFAETNFSDEKRPKNGYCYLPEVENLNVWMMWRNEKTIRTMRGWLSMEEIFYDDQRGKKGYLSLLEANTPMVWIPWRKETRIHTMKVELVEEWDKKEGLDFLERSIIADFTTLGRSEHLWPSLSLCKLLGPVGLILCFNVPI